MRGLCDETFVDGVACGDHAIEQRCSERGEQGVAIGFCWKLTSIDRLGDEGRRTHGLFVEVASGCFAKLSRSEFTPRSWAP